MKRALLLIDLQEDYLSARGLFPHREALCAKASVLLEHFRETGEPVFHVRTTIRDEHERMPHWKATGLTRCVEGTEGHRAPPNLAERPGEAIIDKQFFSSFTNSGLLGVLKKAEVDTLVLAGIYMRACVRGTAIDAYQNGFEVIIAEDAVGDDDSVHRAVTQQHLDHRCATFQPVEELVNGCRAPGGSAARGGVRLPHGAALGFPPITRDAEVKIAVSPRDGVTPLFEVPAAGTDTVADVVGECRRAQPEWESTSPEERRRLVLEIAEMLGENAEPMARRITRDIGKPISASRVEVQFGLDLIRAAVSWSERAQDTVSGGKWSALRRPHGTVAIITPWNNPLSIALGKIAPALIYGNAVAWKPAPMGASVAVEMLRLMEGCGLPSGVLGLLNGGHQTARALGADSGIDAVSLTGSITAGVAVQIIAMNRGIPFQGELGGNNAAIVWHDADLRRAADLIARGGFGSAGQRCTATRRVLVDEACIAEFRTLFTEAVGSMRWGDPKDEQTEIGPVISAESALRLEELLLRASDAGVELVKPHGQPEIPRACRKGHYVRPTIAFVEESSAEVVVTETFGPIVAVQPVASWDDAIERCNAVEQGLVASLFSSSTRRREDFLRRAKAGILKCDAPPAGVEADAPFQGWKRSGVGPPEHGVGDTEFYSRWQTVYAPDGDPR